jgi:chromosomal replication initiation ATPase DnaA
MATSVRTGQLPLDLAHAPSYAREAFLPAECNRLALERVLGWRDWPGGRLVLSGPPSSGKTHLAHIWAASAGAAIVPAGQLGSADVGALAGGCVAVEGADRVAGDAAAERALFHLLNATHQQGRALLITARAEPGRWGVSLPDLGSRIAAAPHVRLNPPDDALLAAVLVKLFDDRGVTVSPHLIGWLVRRMDRSLAAAGEVVARLDEAALAAGGPVTREMAAAVLDKTGGGAA